MTASRRTWRSGPATMPSVPRPSSRGALRGLRRGLARLNHRQPPLRFTKQRGYDSGSGLHISRSLLWLAGLDRTAPRRKARRGGGWERPPPHATPCVTGRGSMIRGKFHVTLPLPGGRSHRNYPCGKAARRAALDHDQRRGVFRCQQRLNRGASDHGSSMHPALLALSLDKTGSCGGIQGRRC